MRSAIAALFMCVAALPAFAAGPAWDTSGNGQLNGTYYFRQVVYQANQNGTVGRAIAYFGKITFDGNGNYSLAGTNTLLDSAGGFPLPATGAYSVALSGYGFMSNPVIAGGSVSFLVSNHILIGSDTESGYNDLFIAAPVPTLSTFNGSYTIDGFQVNNGAPGQAADVSFQLNADGAGHLGTLNMTGYSGGGGTVKFTQTNSNVTYALVNFAATINFPTSSTANFYSGPETVYFSPDGNFVFGGSPQGFDMLVGVRNASGVTPLSGLYYEAGLDEDASQLLTQGFSILDTFYGSLNAYQGNIFGHERVSTAASNAEGYTYSGSYPASISGSYTDTPRALQYTIGAGGARVALGIGPFLGIAVAFPTPSPTPTGSVFLDPTGIVNTASSAPFTAGISPGEFLTLYTNGTILANTDVYATAPYPPNLAGVTVLIDGTPAPIYHVGPSQFDVIVPYAVTAGSVGTIQVVTAAGSSNIVTVLVNQATPGIFTTPFGGIGHGAIEHVGGALVTPDNPALPGETVAAYLSGLGPVFPLNPDGALGPEGTLSNTTNAFHIRIGGIDSPFPLPYAGLAPDLVGLYQVNFQVPLTAPAGDNTFGIWSSDSFSTEATIAVGVASTTASSGTTQAAAAATPASQARSRIPHRLSVAATR